MSEVEKKGRGRPKKKEFVMPSSPSDLKEIQNAVKEASNSLIKIDAERDYIKDTSDNMKEKFGMPPAKFKKLVMIYHKQNLNELEAKHEEIKETYIQVMGDPCL